MSSFYNDPLMPLARRLLSAGSNRDRAGMLLRVPDAVVLEQADALAEACRQAGFHPGADFITLRGVELHRVRDIHGMLPEAGAAVLEGYRVSLSRFVAGASL